MNLKYNLVAASAILMAATSLPLSAADIAHGKELQQKNCMGCHDDGIYTRPNRRVTSLDGLRKQVRRCELSLGLKWFDNDIEDVTAYLNQDFYRFK